MHAGRRARASRPAGRGAVAALVVVAALVSGCYAHHAPARGPAAPAGALLAPMQGRYVIARGGEVVGEERFTITSSAGVWRAEGAIRIDGIVEQRARWALAIDLKTRQPKAFEATLAIEGIEAHVRGRVERGYVIADGDGPSGAWRREVPYGAGTIIELGSPIPTTLATSLLGPALEPKKPVSIRTITFAAPSLLPSVGVHTLVLFDRDGGTSRIAVETEHGARPVAMWVRDDGLPLRVRTPARDGPSWEHRLD
ncbi:hypothetical protein L6R52_08510 [Myxococcota bacterium]|nr:hypothetical protein [Myxococcota bacterium]